MTKTAAGWTCKAPLEAWSRVPEAGAADTELWHRTAPRGSHTTTTTTNNNNKTPPYSYIPQTLFFNEKKNLSK